MNAERRKLIAKAETLVGEALSILTDVRDDEQSAFDNMPESLQQGERGQASEDAIDALTEACDTLDQMEWERMSG
jgi:hypothetical protein